MTRQEEIVMARMADMSRRIDGFDTKILKEMELAYNVAIKSIKVDLIKARQGTTTKAMLFARLREVENMMEVIVKQQTQLAAKGVVDVGEYSYKTMNDIVGWDGKSPAFKPLSLSREQMYVMATETKFGGEVLEDWIGSALLPDIGSIKAEIAAGYVRGSGYAEMMKRLSNELPKFKKGSKEYRDMETVVKTYTQAMNTRAQKDVYKANKELVPSVEWSAIMEGGNTATGRGTCPRCIALDGKTWPTDSKALPNIPLHARCRCLLLPVTKTWAEMGFDIPEMEKQYKPWFVKDAKGKKIEQGRTNQTYDEWWHSQSEAFQNKSVGRKRAELIREGKLTIGEMVDKNGDLIPIAQLGKVKPIKAKPTPWGQPAPIVERENSEGHYIAPKPFVNIGKQEERPEVFNRDNMDFAGDWNPVQRKAMADALQKMTAAQLRAADRLEAPWRYYKDGDRGVYFNNSRIMVADPFFRNGDTARHEYGHHIDSMGVSSKAGKWWSAESKEFKAALINDKKHLGLHGVPEWRVDSILEPYKIEFSTEPSAGGIRHGTVETGNMQDILDALSEGGSKERLQSRFAMYGHGIEYYADQGYSELESFANLWSIRSNPAQWQRAQEIFPHMAAEMERFIDAVNTMPTDKMYDIP